MTSPSTPTAPSGALLLSRSFDAPRALVYEVFTQAEHLMQWWGPVGMPLTACELDLRVGGTFRYGMQVAEGQVMWAKWTFRAIEPGERLEFVLCFCDEHGTPMPNPMTAVWPPELLNCIRFVERGARTTVQLWSMPHQASAAEAAAFTAAFADMRQGWGGTFAQLADYLATLHPGTEPEAAREMVVSRVFDAPRARIWQVWTEPEHVARWWGPAGFTNTIHAMELRPGGVWRYTMHGPDGTDYVNVVEYIEVEPAARLVYWHSGDEDWPMDPFHVTVTFEELGGQTRVTLRMLIATIAQRNELIEFGAVEGGHSTLACLAEYLETMA